MTAIDTGRDAFQGTQPIATSFYGVSGDASLITSIYLKWDATLVATITVWTTNLPDVALGSTTAGDWVQQNPPTGYTAISPAGAGTAATPLVLTIPGGTAGAADIQIGNFGSKYMRVGVVATTAGALRIRHHGKQ